jgi:hypothetical protein
MSLGVHMSLKRSIQPPPDAPFRLALGPARFFLDDIRDVHDALSDFSKKYADDSGQNNIPGEVKIRALSATADKVEDLKEATRAELNHVTLILSSPAIRIDLWRRSAGIIAVRGSATVRSFAESIRY